LFWSLCRNAADSKAWLKPVVEQKRSDEVGHSCIDHRTASPGALRFNACFCVQSLTAADDAEITIKAVGHNADAHVHVLPDQVRLR
jgi:hypothetical protein